MSMKELLEIIVCTKCKGSLLVQDENLYCESCEISFPIVDGIPVMLLDEEES